MWRAGLGLVLGSCLPAFAHAAADVAKLGDAVDVVAGSVTSIPIYVRDVSASPLGVDQPVGARIQGLAFRVDFPASAILAANVVPSGITAALTPAFGPTSGFTPGSVNFLVAYNETSNLIPFVLDAPAEGNEVATIQLTIHPAQAPGTVVLTANVASELSNQAGTIAENVGNGGLVLLGGSVQVLSNAPTGLHARAESASAVRLRWKDPQAVETGFRVQRSSDGSSWSDVQDLGPDVADYLAGGLAPATLYYWRVLTLVGAETGGASNRATASTHPASATQVCVDPFVVSRRWARSPDVVHHGSGWTLVYHDRDDGSHEQVWWQRLDDASAAPAGARVRLSNSATATSFPALGWNGTRYAVTWFESLRGAPGSQPANSLQFMRVEADGSPRRGPRPLETQPLGLFGVNEMVRPHWDGSHWGVFVPEHAVDVQGAVRFRRLDEDGNTVVGPTVIHESVLFFVMDVDAAWQPLTGEYGVIWLAQRDDGYQLLFQRVEESNGAPQLGSPASVAAWNEWDSSAGTSLVADPAGGWLAAWTRCDAIGCPLYTRRISAAGVPDAGGAVRVGAPDAGEFRPRLARRSGGYALYADVFPQQELGRYLLDAAGLWVAGPDPVSAFDSRQSGRARLASDGSRVLAAWSEAASTLEVAGRLAAGDSSLGPEVVFTSGHDAFNTAGVYTPGQPRIVGLDGGFFALWTEVQAGTSVLAGRLYAADGSVVASYLPFGSSPAVNSNSRPGLAALGASFAAAWRAPGGLLRFTRRAADGSVLVPEATLASGVGGGPVELAWNGEHFALLYPLSGNLHYLRVDSSGVPQGAPQQLALGAITATGVTRMAWLGDSWALAWREGATGNLVYARIAADGTVLQAPVVFAPAIAPFGAAGDLSIAWDGSELGATWSAFVGADPPMNQLYFAIIGRDGSLAFPAAQLEPSNTFRPQPQLHLTPEGFGVVYFADNDFTVGLRELRLQRVAGGVNVTGSRFLANRGSASAATFHDGQTLAMAWRVSPTQNIHIETDACLADPSPPPCPLLAAGSANDAVRLSWPSVADPQSGIWNYLVHRDGKLIAELPATADQYDDTGYGTATIHQYRVDALNRAFQPSAACAARSYSTLVGDANGNGVLEVADIFYLNNALLANGPPPAGDADANGDGLVSAADIFFIINYFFGGGPPPTGGLPGTGRGVPAPSGAPDELALGALLAAPGTQARVPVYVRDLSGTLLDEGDGPDHEIQSFAFQVMFPPAFVDTVTFVHAGITAGRVAFFSQVTPGPDNLYVLKSFNEQSQPLVFTLDGAAPGDLIGEILIDIDPATPDGTPIGLSLQAFNAALVDASATESETVANGHLLLRNATLVVGQQQLFRNGFE